jgi:hypothetical protein
MTGSTFTMLEKRFRGTTALAALGAALAIATCGAGGGGGNDRGGGAVTGVLWHNNFALDTSDGTQLASPTGQPPRRLDANGAARAIPDGSRYAIYDYDNRKNATTLFVKRRSDGVVLHQRSFGGYAIDLVPSPVNAAHLLMRFTDDAGNVKKVFVAVDLATGKLMPRWRGCPTAAWWPSTCAAISAPACRAMHAPPPAASTPPAAACAT